MPEISIELLPEFGWSTQGQPTYGPGSVFQGFVHASSREEIEVDHIRLQFHAVESMHPIEVRPGVTRRKRPHILFVIRHVLWTGQSLDSSQLTLPFTIQMPLVQYPPSMDHEYYQCAFKLTAFIEQSSQIIQSTEKSINYRPFIETCVLKNPVQTTGGQVQVHALEYVPGDAISARITMGSRENASGDASSGSGKRIVIATLYQTAILHPFEDIPKRTKVIASQRWYEDDVSGQDLLKSDLKPPSLRIPLDSIPSFSYSSFFAVSYQLKVSVKHKKFAGLWSSGQEYEFPVTIGTLARGVRAPAQLRIYSTLSSDERQVEEPRFMGVIAGSETLPPYDSTHLPTYETITVP
ncbi:hypothetical protein BJV82DRAFT_672372 [Fennellomyces sp. T-0311]|nr:hypothetical protein BJV82DRAFT_672372 [Fennellomyces sp. T-0311]